MAGGRQCATRDPIEPKVRDEQIGAKGPAYGDDPKPAQALRGEWRIGPMRNKVLPKNLQGAPFGHAANLRPIALLRPRQVCRPQVQMIDLGRSGERDLDPCPSRCINDKVRRRLQKPAIVGQRHFTRQMQARSSHPFRSRQCPG
jgi:hypothetical protein